MLLILDNQIATEHSKQTMYSYYRPVERNNWNVSVIQNKLTPSPVSTNKIYDNVKQARGIHISDIRNTHSLSSVEYGRDRYV